MNKLILLAALLVQTPVFAAPGDAACPVTVTKLPAAQIYTWRCPEPRYIAAPLDWKPGAPTVAELKRLQVLAGYSREPDFMKAKAMAILAAPVKP